MAQKKLSLYGSPALADYRYPDARSARGVGIRVSGNEVKTVSQIWEGAFRDAWSQAQRNESRQDDTPKSRRSTGRARMISLLKSNEFLNNPAFQRAGIHPEAVLEIGQEKLQEIHEKTPDQTTSRRDPATQRTVSNRWMGGVKFSEVPEITSTTGEFDESGYPRGVSELDEIQTHPSESKGLQRSASQDLRYGSNIDDPDAVYRSDRFDPSYDIAKDPDIESLEGRPEKTHLGSGESYRFDADGNRIPRSSGVSGGKPVSPTGGRLRSQRWSQSEAALMQNYGTNLSQLGNPQSTAQGWAQAGVYSQPSGDPPKDVAAAAQDFDFDFEGIEEERVERVSQTPEGVQSLEDQNLADQEARLKRESQQKLAGQRYRFGESILNKPGTSPRAKIAAVKMMSRAQEAVPKMVRTQVTDVTSESPIPQGDYEDTQRVEVEGKTTKAGEWKEGSPVRGVVAPPKDPAGNYVNRRGRPIPKIEATARSQYGEEIRSGEYSPTSQQRVTSAAISEYGEPRVKGWVSNTGTLKADLSKKQREGLPTDTRGTWDPKAYGASRPRGGTLSEKVARRASRRGESLVGDPTPDALPTSTRVSSKLTKPGGQIEMLVGGEWVQTPRTKGIPATKFAGPTKSKPRAPRQSAFPHTSDARLAKEQSTLEPVQRQVPVSKVPAATRESYESKKVSIAEREASASRQKLKSELKTVHAKEIFRNTLRRALGIGVKGLTGAVGIAADFTAFAPEAGAETITTRDKRLMKRTGGKLPWRFSDDKPSWLTGSRSHRSRISQ